MITSGSSPIMARARDRLRCSIPRVETSISIPTFPRPSRQSYPNTHRFTCNAASILLQVSARMAALDTRIDAESSTTLTARSGGIGAGRTSTETPAWAFPSWNSHFSNEAGNFATNFEGTVWEYAPQGGWRTATSEPRPSTDPNLNVPQPPPPVPRGCEFGSPESIAKDRLGTFWLTYQGQLIAPFPGLLLPQTSSPGTPALYRRTNRKGSSGGSAGKRLSGNLPSHQSHASGSM